MTKGQENQASNAGFKIRRPKKREGSNPSSGTSTYAASVDRSSRADPPSSARTVGPLIDPGPTRYYRNVSRGTAGLRHIVVQAAVEGITDEAVVRRLAAHVGAHVGAVVVADLDRDHDCAPRLVGEWLGEPSALMCFRVAVRAVEAWLLADDEAIAGFLGVARTADGVDDLLEHAGALCVLLDEEEEHHRLDADALLQRGLEREHGRAFFTFGVSARSREAVDVRDLRERAVPQDRHPRLQVALEDLVFGAGVRLEVPDRGLRRGHGVYSLLSGVRSRICRRTDLTAGAASPIVTGDPPRSGGGARGSARAQNRRPPS
jgi:hypothetical protein